MVTLLQFMKICCVSSELLLLADPRLLVFPCIAIHVGKSITSARLNVFCPLSVLSFRLLSVPVAS